MKNALTNLGGHAWRHVFMASSKLEAMAIYVVKQACGNEIMPSVYVGKQISTCTNFSNNSKNLHKWKSY